MCRITLLLTILYLSLHHAHQYQILADEENSEPDIHFEIFIFAQEWPVTYCKEWIHDTGLICGYPLIKENEWFVHGIWRRKNSQYTVYCNNSWVFEPEQIKTIRRAVEDTWIHNFQERNTDVYWSHQWQKHGTCAAAFEPLNSQFKYFNKGIEWNQQYSLPDILAAANIIPDDTKEFTSQNFVDAVKAKTKKNPMVVCSTFKGVQFLKDLSICFDTQFNVIDCLPVVDDTCDASKSIIFPSTVRM